MANVESGVFVKQPASTRGRREAGLASVFPISVKPGAVAHRYEVDIVRTVSKRDGRAVQETLLKPAADDGRKASLTRVCYHMMELAYDIAECFGMEPDARIVYDNRRTLYASEPIPIVGPEAQVHIIPKDVAPEILAELGTFTQISVVIKPNGTLDLTDLSQYAREAVAQSEDRSLRQFFEMLFSMFAMFTETYSPVGGSSKLFLKDPATFKRIGNGIVLRSGVSKGVRIIEGAGQITPALVVDVKTCAFFAPQSLLTTVMEMCRGGVPPAGSPEWDHVRVAVSYQPSRTFTIRGFTTQPVEQITIASADGNQVSLAQYFATKPANRVKLNYLKAPAVIPDLPSPAGMEKPSFPIEVLNILPDQRVPLCKMNEHLSSTLLTANSILPAERYTQTLKHCQSLCLFGQENPIMEGFGVSIDSSANGVSMKVREPPVLQYENEQAVVVPTEASWRPSNRVRYSRTMEEPIKWVVLCSAYNALVVRRFTERYVKMATDKGMPFGNAVFVNFDSSKRNQFEDLFPKFYRDGVHFAMLVDPRTVTSHDSLKYYERHSQVITQHVTLEKARDVVEKNQNQTLANIVNKSNCKLFGQNYVPVMHHLKEEYRLENGVFVLGYDVNHPTAMSKQDLARLRQQGVHAVAFDPSVVGFAANATADPNTFVGDFFFQEARREELDAKQLAEKVVEALELLAIKRPQHKAPKLIVVVRDGLSEGQFKMAVDRELLAILEGCERYQADYRPRIVFIVCTKRHDKRFFRNVNGRLENPLPGTVVDENVVRPDVNEFFVQAHKPLKGTSKFVQYSMLVNEAGMSLDDAEEFLSGLCYNHQIVNRAVSIPEPVYQADELAKRGRNFLREMKNTSPELVPRTPEGLVDGPALSRLVGYSSTWMSPTRFTA
ncbi:piwi domain-containing protein [Aphelenchoides avenae]|nr:piwi domain-containing protein [Aphelenchus avenae]